MELQYRLLACYLLAINVATLITFGIDKLKAKRAKWRIPEATLLMMAAVGGSVGAWAGIKLWHNKTRHKKFRYGIPVCYLLAINVATLITFGIDKLKAKRAKWRIPEATLLMMAAVGGSVGAWAGIKLWHHKTRHKKFRYGIPVIFALQIALAGYLWLA